MEAGIFKVQVDFGQLQDAINEAVDQAIERHALKSSLPPILTKQQLMDLLDVGATKASELLNRNDFPVIREFGHPRVPTHSLMTWIDEHTEWIRDNAGEKSKVKGKGRVA
ncbi:DNA-binding protein [Paenibacillus sp. FSL M8-0142]|uniref:DNA-binding protein n=1 Tax=Paenibacillus sp. FSL M8-0142 TaxID=2954525 RepID=UPI003159BA6D